MRWEFSVLAEGRSYERRSAGAGHYKDLTETGNRARKVSGTQGTPVAKFALIVGVSETGLAAIEFKWRLKIRRAKHKSIYD